MIPLPSRQSKTWTQTNTGEVFGSIYSSKNIDLNKDSYAQLSLRASALVYGVSNFTDVLSINYFNTTNSGYYILTGDNSGRPFRLDLSVGTPYDLTADTNGSGIGGSRKYDATIWQNRWYVSGDTTFAYHNGNTTWTTGLGSLTSGNFHPLCVFESLTYLAIGDGNTVKLYDSSHSLVTTLTIPTTFEVKWIKYLNNNIYIGTKNLYGGDANMFVWNGSGTAAQGGYPIKGESMFSGEVYQSSIITFTSRGNLLRFSGGGWTKLASLPVDVTDKSWTSSNSGYSVGKVSPRGMAVDEDIIYINIDGSLADDTFLINQPSGIWVYDPKNGLYHRSAYSNNKVELRTITGLNTSTDTFTANSSFTAVTGTQIFYKGSVATTGLYLNRFYFLIRVSGTTFKLATTYDNAIAGTAIDVTSAGTAESIYFHDDTDFGVTNPTSIKAGAICIISDSDLYSQTYKQSTGSNILYGLAGLPNTTLSSTSNTLQTLTSGENRGYIITPKIFTSQLKEEWQRIYSLLGNIYEGNDKVIIKYRITDKQNYPINNSGYTCTWSDSDTFTTTQDLTGVAAGDEVEITNGAAAGSIANISSLTYLSGTWTVNLDATFTVSVSDKSSFFIQNWTQIASGTYSDIDSFLEASIGTESKWIQFKIELRGVSKPFIEELQIVNNVNRPSN